MSSWQGQEETDQKERPHHLTSTQILPKSGLVLVLFPGRFCFPSHPWARPPLCSTTIVVMESVLAPERSDWEPTEASPHLIWYGYGRPARKMAECSILPSILPRESSCELGIFLPRESSCELGMLSQI